MPNQKISQLPPAGPLSGSEIFAIAQGATTVGLTASILAAFLGTVIPLNAANLVGQVPSASLPSNFSGLAAPAAQIGLAAIPGTATTAMRSDAAPALDQAIAPVWSGHHQFNRYTDMQAGAVVASQTANVGGATWATLNTNYGLANTGRGIFLWNFAGLGAGETDLIINRGPGSGGGFYIYDFPNTSGPITNLFGLTGAGALQLLGPVGIGIAPSTATALDVGATPAGGVGIKIELGTPSVVTNALYNVAGALWFNGAAVGGGGGGGTYANPTALVGLTAVNGSLNSGIRSDAASALDQSIAPTWTGSHTFTRNILIGPAAVPDALLTLNGQAAGVVAPGSLPVGTLFHIYGSNGGPNRVVFDGVGAVFTINTRRANGTAAAPTSLAPGDVFLNLAGFGWAGSAYTASARAAIQFTAAEPWTATAQGSFISLQTTSLGAVGLSERIRIWSHGGISVNATDDPGAGNLSVFGSITSYATTPFQPQLVMWDQTNDANSGYFIVRKTRGAALGTSAVAVQVGDVLGTFNFAGADANGALANSAYLTTIVNSVAAGSIQSTMLFFAQQVSMPAPLLQVFNSPTAALYSSQFYGYTVNQFQIANDNMALAGATYDVGIYHQFGGSAVTGSRCGFLSYVVLTAPTSNSNTLRQYTGAAFIGAANSAGDGGTNTGAGARGSIFGLNVICEMYGTSGSPSLNWLNNGGLEIDMYGTANVSQKYNWPLSLVSVNVVQGTAMDTAIMVYSGSQSPYGPGVGFRNGIVFGEVGGNGRVPLSATASLIAGYVETLATITIAFGVDLRKFTVTGFAYDAGKAGSPQSKWGISSTGAVLGYNFGVGVPAAPALKRDIRRMGSAKRAIQLIQPVHFNWRGDVGTGLEGHRDCVGFLASDHHNIGGVERGLAGFADGVLFQDMDTPLGRHNGYWRDDMVPILWRGVQELWSETDALMDRMNGLERRVAEVERRLQ